MGYTLLVSLIEYKTLVMRGDLERASELLPSIPKEHHNRCVQSLQISFNYIWLFGHSYVSFDRPKHSLLQK
jgi:hypothetical protein